MHDAIEQFCREYHAFHGISGKRRLEQRAVLLRFERHHGRPLTTATARDFEGFLVAMIEEGLSPAMVQKMRNMVRPFFRWAAKAELIELDILDRILTVPSPRAREISKDPRPYTRAELDKFYAALHEACPLVSDKALGWWRRGRSNYRRVRRHGMRLQIEAIIGLALYCGLRRFELFAVELDDIAPENEYVVVRDGKGTGKQPRVVPYPDELRQIVKAWLSWRAELEPNHDRVWLSLYTQASEGPSTAMMEQRFNTILAHVVGKGWTLHRFRHTCGTEWLRAGVPIERVMDLLGHGDISMTLRYAKVAKADVRRSMRNAEPQFVAAVGPRPPEPIAA